MPHASNKSSSLCLGDLISAALENARAVTPDERTAAQLASQKVARWLARSGRLDIAKRLRRV